MLEERTLPDEYVNERGNGVTDAYRDWPQAAAGRPAQAVRQLLLSSRATTRPHSTPEGDMKHIFLNLKRFDIVPELGGVNRLAAPAQWGEAVTSSIRQVAAEADEDAQFAAFLPEAHLVGAVRGAEGSPLGVGCQGVHTADTAVGGGFGAFTTLRTGNSVAQLGCGWALVGHCEERMNLRAVMGEAGAEGPEVEAAVSRILSREVVAAQAAGLKVLFCMGERTEEQPEWERVISDQVQQGLDGADPDRVRIAYKPVWSIGPGKVPADAPYIQKVAVSSSPAPPASTSSTAAG